MSQATSNSEKEPSLKAAIPSEGEEEGALLVDWEGPDDKANPCNWPSRKRWAHIIIVAILGLIPYVAHNVRSELLADMRRLM